MTNPRFDKNRSFGSIHPPVDGAMFEQDGCYFSGAGEFLRRVGQEPAARVQEEAGAPAPVPPAPEVDPKLEAEPVMVAPVAKTETETNKIVAAALSAAGVDLAAWARGEANYPFFSVKKQAAGEYPDLDVSNTKTIVAGLVAAGIVAEADVKR